MSLLTHTELCELVEQGVITNVDMKQVNGASIDLSLADGYLIEDRPYGCREYVRLADKETPKMLKAAGDLVLKPGDFALAATEQMFYLPNDITAIYVLKSSLARAGLNHLNAGFADPSWHSSALTLEFKNELRHHTLVLTPGQPCGQMYFLRGNPVPELASYAVRGQYCGDTGVQASKGVR